MRLSHKQLGATLGWFVLLLSGCGQGVQEDRSIHFSANGARVGFQNGGVFVADPETGKPRKIFETPADVIATSAPLWSPAGKRLIFTTARLASGEAPPHPTEQDPAGAIFPMRDIVYTCWLRDESQGPDKAENIKLFDAACEHTGYVGANLAVRWHPKGDRILFLDRTAAKLHSLFEFALETKKARRIFPHSGEALIFDGDPAGKSLVVAVGSFHPNAALDGLWLSTRDEDDWWHIPRTHELARADITSLIERLRATLPVWTPDGARFAFATSTGGPNEQPARHTLHLGDTAKREVEEAVEDPEPLRDLHWSPDAAQLGFIRGSADGSLQILAGKDRPVRSLREKGVRHFAGWDHSGNHLAYVAAETPVPNDSPWTTLLVPDPAARDVVVVAPGDGKLPGEIVFSGLRVTFPQWSPTDEKLSLWLTFSPTHHSLPNVLAGSGLRNGDPAATLNVLNGAITWMATNAFEKAQIGHYHLARRDYERAWKWYSEAERDLPPAKPAAGAEAAFSPLRDFTFFEYYCLTKLGRPDDAKAKWDQFTKAFAPPAIDKNAAQPAPVNQPIARLDWRLDLQSRIDLLRDLYMAEVFLSLNAAEDGQAYFEKALKDAPDEETKARIALVLSQFHLVRKQHGDYARLATDVILPHLLKSWKPRKDGTLNWAGRHDTGLAALSVVALAPLATPEFLATLSDQEVRTLLPRWTDLRVGVTEVVPQLGLDLILQAAYSRLGQDKEKPEAAQRIQNNPARKELVTPELEKNPVEALREAVVQYEQLVQLVRGL